MTRRSSRCAAAALAAALALGAPTASRAQPGPSREFVAEYNAGVDAFRLGDYAEARRRLEAARALDPRLPGPWRFLAAVAQAERRWDDCVEAAREAIRLNPRSSEIATTRTLHDACREQDGRPPYAGTYEPGFGALAVAASEPGAVVEVNGLGYGATPLAPRALAAGAAQVAVIKAGFIAARVTVDVLEGVVTDVEVALEPDPAAAAAADDDAPAAGPATGWVVLDGAPPDADVRVDGAPAVADAQGRFVVPPGAHTVEIRAPGREPMVRPVRVTAGAVVRVPVRLRVEAELAAARRRGGLALGVGLGVLAAGAVAGLVALDAADEARDWWWVENTRPISPETGGLAPVRTRAEIEARVDDSRRWTAVSMVTLGVGAAAAAVGAYYLSRGRPAGERSLRVTPLLGVGGPGAAAIGEVRW